MDSTSSFGRIYQTFKSKVLSTSTFNILFCAYLIIAFNAIFLAKVDELHSTPGFKHLVFMATVVILLFIVLHFFITLLTYRFLHKTAAVILLISSASAYFYMDTFGIMIDKTMAQNVLETDLAEAHEVMSFSMFLFVLIFGVLPATLVYFVNIEYPPILKGTWVNLRNILISFIGIGLIAAFFYKDYASLFRTNPYIRDIAVPINVVNAAKGIIKDHFFHSHYELMTMGMDAKRGSLWTEKNKRVVSVLIVGETARAENFSLNGYERNTNPLLSELDIVNFNQVSSCGTTTAISVPCLFAKATRDQFDSKKADFTENILDIVQRAGLGVYWIDNNSSCKDVCNRVIFIDVSEETDAKLCKGPEQGLIEIECYDEILLGALRKTIA